MRFWSRNLDLKGRVLRITAGVLFGAAATLLWHERFPAAAIGAGTVGAFCGVQGFSGWCLFRACSLAGRKSGGQTEPS